MSDEKKEARKIPENITIQHSDGSLQSLATATAEDPELKKDLERMKTSKGLVIKGPVVKILTS